MLTVVDVLKAVAAHGTVDTDELEAAIPDPGPGVDDGFWKALDAAVDQGCLRIIAVGKGTECRYQVNSRGRRLLRSSSRASMAA